MVKENDPAEVLAPDVRAHFQRCEALLTELHALVKNAPREKDENGDPMPMVALAGALMAMRGAGAGMVVRKAVAARNDQRAAIVSSLLKDMPRRARLQATLAAMDGAEG